MGAAILKMIRLALFFLIQAKCLKDISQSQKYQPFFEEKEFSCTRINSF
jgi:hypothetical protein